MAGNPCFCSRITLRLGLLQDRLSQTYNDDALCKQHIRCHFQQDTGNIRSRKPDGCDKPLGICMHIRRMPCLHMGNNRHPGLHSNEFRAGKVQLQRSRFPVNLIYTIVLPKGTKARMAILKCCMPNGIPTMVMQHRRPKAT